MKERERRFVFERRGGRGEEVWGSFSVFSGLSIVQSSAQLDPTRAINKGD
jgi:hypothetical protein